MRTALVIAALLAASAPASAGICGDDDVARELHGLDAFAVSPKNALPELVCVTPLARGGTPAQTTRIATACAKVLARDAAQADCLELAGYLGKPELGGVDIVAVVVGWPLEPRTYGDGRGADRTLDIMLTLHDARAVAPVAAMWKASAPKADAWHGEGAMAWAGWRTAAAKVLGALGGADEQALLDATAKSTKDKYVRAACADASAAIAKRLAAK